MTAEELWNSLTPESKWNIIAIIREIQKEEK